MRCYLVSINLGSRSMSCSEKLTVDLTGEETGPPPYQRGRSELSIPIEMIPPCQFPPLRALRGKGISRKRERIRKNKGVASLSNKPRQLRRGEYSRKKKRSLLQLLTTGDPLKLATFVVIKITGRKVAAYIPKISEQLQNPRAGCVTVVCTITASSATT